ncbi:DUF3862 domain-containing protein [Lacticaseibacillus zhaodongensis]|uniref:DUF3862 domain-containing protein n=1 Tax=Lacticaseibacillus zhaodongensis TaxID=2668065 RepID=UPI0018AF74DC|nr:DUF3862 domain-containing protein [Lacticaseibacillus zhaodongensis]
MSLSDFESIQLGDVAKDGAGGVTKEELVAKWGKPISRSNSSFQNVQTELLTWNKVANADFTATFTVQLANKRVVQKAIQGLKVRRERQLTLDDYNAIQAGDTESDVVSRLGKPNGYSENILNGMVTKELSYTSDIKGQAGANFAVTVQNGQVTLKSQVNME